MANEVQQLELIENAMLKVESMISVIQEDSATAGQGTVERIANNLFNIISHLMEAVNYNVYNPEEAKVIATMCK